MATKKKVVKKVVRKTASKGINVMVGRLGSAPVAVAVTIATVQKVLDKAKIDLTGAEQVWLNGAKTLGTAKVRSGDIVSVVAPKEAGYHGIL